MPTITDIRSRIRTAGARTTRGRHAAAYVLGSLMLSSCGLTFHNQEATPPQPLNIQLADAAAPQPSPSLAGNVLGVSTTGAPKTAARKPVAARPAPPPVAAGNSSCKKPADSVGGNTLAKGQRPPDFTATTLDCKSLTLSAYTQGHPTLVNFWASWCHACQVEEPDLEQAYTDYNPQNGFVIVGVDAIDSGDAIAYNNKFRMTYPSVWDPGTPGKIAKAYQVTQALPVSVFIRRDGTVDAIRVGSIDRAYIDQEMKNL
jgi:thiol-disulfide isomerase/thioredoxin